MHKLDIGENRRKFASLLGRHKNYANTQPSTEMLDERREIEKSIQDIHDLEKYYTDREHRKRLESLAEYPSSEYFKLKNIHEQEAKLKDKLGLAQNALIRYEKVKCSKNCIHDTPPHQYYYAYTWDSNSKKLKKKYLGKQLPLPLPSL